jgi:two-component system heavy metal sensor histidine kinase CusS
MSTIRPLSIGAKWTIRYTGATFILISVLAVHLYGRISDHILSGAEIELVQRSAAIAEAIARHPGDPQAVVAFIETEITGSNPDLRLAVQLLDSNAEPKIKLDILAPLTEPIPSWRPVSSTDRLLYEIDRGEKHPYYAVIEPNGDGLTQVVISGAPFLRSVEYVRSLFLLVLPVGLLSTGLLGWWLARRSLRPISRMTEAAQRISASNTNESIEVAGTGDELDMLGSTLNEMFGRIQYGLDRMRRFASNAAHQLRTPLSVLRTRIEVALQKERSLSEYREILELTLDKIELMTEEIDSMLRFAQAEAGLDPDRLSLVRLDAELTSIVEFFQPLAEQKGVLLSCKADGESVVAGEPAWLHQVFANLIDNAIKYTDSGGIVTVEVGQRDTNAVVEISDTGMGMEPAELEPIFDRFHRASEGTERTGTGLGLPLAREIARAHGGDVEVASALGQGSTFTVVLPAAE